MPGLPLRSSTRLRVPRRRPRSDLPRQFQVLARVSRLSSSITPGVHSRFLRLAASVPSAARCVARLVPPSGLGPPSAASSHQSLPGLLHPGAGHEVHRVSSPQPVRLSPPFHHTTSPWLGGLRPRTSTPPDGGTALRHRGGKAEDPAARLRCARFPAMHFTPFEEPARWSLPVRPLAPEPCRVAAVVAPSPFFSLRSRLPWSSPRALASQRALGSWHRVAYGLGAFLPVACVTRARAVASLDLGSPSFHWASFPFEIRSFLRSPLPARRSLAA